MNAEPELKKKELEDDLPVLNMMLLYAQPKILGRLCNSLTGEDVWDRLCQTAKVTSVGTVRLPNDLTSVCAIEIF